MVVSPPGKSSYSVTEYISFSASEVIVAYAMSRLDSIDLGDGTADKGGTE